MPHSPATISFALPAYNEEENIQKILNHLRIVKKNLDEEQKINFEILIINDGSTDKTEEIVKQYPSVTYLHQKNNGPASARNNGWHNGKGDIIAFLDSDCVPRKNWLRKMVSNYTSDSVVCVGSRYGISNKNNFLACCIYFEFLIRYKRMPRHPKFLGSHGYSFRKSFLEKFHGYSEEYKMASHEDNELAYRIIAKGYTTIFDKTNIVDHQFPTNVYKYMRIQFWHGYWRMKLYTDHPRLVTGDDYSDVWDYMQPPLMVLWLILLPFSFLTSVYFIEWILFLTAIALQLPITRGIVQLSGKKRYYCYIPFGIVRALARGLGMCKGIIHFWLKRKA